MTRSGRGHEARPICKTNNVAKVTTTARHRRLLIVLVEIPLV